MDITIIGAGNMGRGIGTRAAAGGHAVTFVDNNGETAAKTAAEVQKAARYGAQVGFASLEDVQFGDVVVKHRQIVAGARIGLVLREVVARAKIGEAIDIGLLRAPVELL